MKIFSVLKRIYQDFHFFVFQVALLGQKLKYLLEKLPVTCHWLLKLLIFLIKLTASLPVSVLFRCNPLRFRPVTLIFELSKMSNFSANRCSITSFTVSVAFSLSVLLTKFDIHTFDWGNVFSIKLLTLTKNLTYYLKWFLMCYLVRR